MHLSMIFVSHFNSNINLQYSWYHIPFLECHLNILNSSLKLLATNSLKFRGASLRKGCRVKFSGSVNFHVLTLYRSYKKCCFLVSLTNANSKVANHRGGIHLPRMGQRFLWPGLRLC